MIKHHLKDVLYDEWVDILGDLIEQQEVSKSLKATAHNIDVKLMLLASDDEEGESKIPTFVFDSGYTSPRELPIDDKCDYLRLDMQGS